MIQIKKIVQIILLLISLCTVKSENANGQGYKDVINDIIEIQKENFQYYSPLDVRYAYYDFNNDNENELLWITPVGGLNLLDIPIYIIYSNGTYLRIDNSKYMTKSIDDLLSTKKYVNQNGEYIYLIKTDVFSTGEKRICDRFYNADFEFINGYKLVFSDEAKYYFIEIVNDEFVEKEIDDKTYETYKKSLSENSETLTYIQDIPLIRLNEFSVDDIDDFISRP
jgi:hypothetical protein